MSRSHRDEFSRKVRAAVFARAFDQEAGVRRCEHPACRAVLKTGEGQVDHVLPVELGGKPTTENAKLICRPCHVEKTAADIGRVRKSDRQRDKHTGAFRPRAKIASRGFVPATPQHRATGYIRRFPDA